MFDEAHAVGDNDVYEALSKITHCRRFGFTATPCRSDGTKLIMETYFGPELVDIPYERAVDQGLVTDIKYVLLDPTGPAFIDDNVDAGKVTSDLFKKRFGYWRNTQRNMAIAGAVRAALEHGLQVLVLVETLEHAVLLESQVLPDIPVVHYGKTSESAFASLAHTLLDCKPVVGAVVRWAQSQGYIYDRNTAETLINQWLYQRYKLDAKTKASWCDKFKKGEIRAMIATMTLSEGVDFPELAVVVRGDGLASRVANEQIPGRLSRLFTGKRYGILVDFSDSFSRFTKRKATTRTSIYDDMSWEHCRDLEQVMKDVFGK